MSDYGIRQVGAVIEPITLEEARMHLRLVLSGSPPSSPDDQWVTNIGIPGARDWCEQYLGRSIAAQTIQLVTDTFPTDPIPLPFGPVLSVEGITYIDEADADQTVDPATYALNQFTDPPQIDLVSDAEWPTSNGDTNSVVIEYTAGYNLADDTPIVNPLPGGIRAAMLLMLGHLFENRENTVSGRGETAVEVPNGAASLLERYRLRTSIA